MHVCILGAGALGRVYGVRLAQEAGETVSFAVRGGAREGAMRIERVDGEAHVLVRPARVGAIPGDADVVLVCVRVDQLAAALPLLEDGPNVPAVVLTPMFPATYAALQERLGARVVAAMPGVTAYAREDGTIRYWLPRTATTLLEEPRGAPDAALAELVGALDRARIAARFAMGVHEQSPATTLAFLPLILAIDLAGGVDALLEDDALLARTMEATDEASALAASIGSIATWASVLLKFASPLTLKVGVAIAKKRSPEAFRYVDERFGQRAHAQNVALAEEAVALADSKGASCEALRELAARMGVLASA